MKTTTKILKIAIIYQFAICNLPLQAQSVGINNTGAAPNASALLDLSSTNKGFLITRADTISIASPAFGLMTLAPLDSCLYLFNGAKWMGMGGGGKNCSCNCTTSPPPPVFPCGGTVIPIVEVTNVFTGKIWMDRNLGASQVATSSTDAAAYGDLYQWGRCSDGHESRTSGTTSTLSSSDVPGHPNFITSTTSPFDWRSPQNNTLWQGVAGINNPCPTGYRLPTELELNDERLSWVQPPISSTNNSIGAFASPLKLPLSGIRSPFGSLINVGVSANYWSSTISSSLPMSLGFGSTGLASMNGTSRGNGFSVRCIKN